MRARGLLRTAASLLSGGYAGQSLEIIREQHARGCVFARAAATPWAAGGILLVGTWGPNPPTYEQCWKNLPVLP